MSEPKKKLVFTVDELILGEYGLLSLHLIILFVTLVIFLAIQCKLQR